MGRAMMCQLPEFQNETSRHCKHVIHFCNSFFGSFEDIVSVIKLRFSGAILQIDSATRVFRAHSVIHESLHHFGLDDVCTKADLYQDGVFAQDCTFWKGGSAYGSENCMTLVRRKRFQGAIRNADNVAQLVTAIWKG